MNIWDVWIIGFVVHIIISIIIAVIFLDDISDEDDMGSIIGGYCIFTLMVGSLWFIAYFVVVFWLIGVIIKKKYKQGVTR